jgi:predicted component of viral defense system (DUF524 family)
MRFSTFTFSKIILRHFAKYSDKVKRAEITETYGTWSNLRVVTEFEDMMEIKINFRKHTQGRVRGSNSILSDYSSRVLPYK